MSSGALPGVAGEPGCRAAHRAAAHRAAAHRAAARLAPFGHPSLAQT